MAKETSGMQSRFTTRLTTTFVWQIDVLIEWISHPKAQILGMVKKTDDKLRPGTQVTI